MSGNRSQSVSSFESKNKGRAAVGGETRLARDVLVDSDAWKAAAAATQQQRREKAAAAATAKA